MPQQTTVNVTAIYTLLSAEWKCQLGNYVHNCSKIVAPKNSPCTLLWRVHNKSSYLCNTLIPKAAWKVLKLPVFTGKVRKHATDKTFIFQMCCLTRRRTCVPGPPGWTACGPMSSVWRSRRAAPSTARWGSAWPAARRATSAWWPAWKPRTSAGARLTRSNRARCTTAGVKGAWRRRRTACAFTGGCIRVYKVGLDFSGTVLCVLVQNKRPRATDLCLELFNHLLIKL